MSQTRWFVNMVCTRKKRYYSYRQAKEAREAMAAKGRNVERLQVFECSATADEHWHLGNKRSGAK